MYISRSYVEYIRSPRWKAKREAVFRKYGKRCYACKTTKKPIQVHHLTYAHLGNERLSELRPLCLKCHREVGRLHWKLGKRRVNGFRVFEIFIRMKKNGTM